MSSTSEDPPTFESLQAQMKRLSNLVIQHALLDSDIYRNALQNSTRFWKKEPESVRESLDKSLAAWYDGQIEKLEKIIQWKEFRSENTRKCLAIYERALEAGVWQKGEGVPWGEDFHRFLYFTMSRMESAPRAPEGTSGPK
ncbi:MAG: hypothetical protein Q9167_003606 [Letrouitia subvulpina]